MNKKYMFIVGALMTQFSLSQMVYSGNGDPEVELPYNDNSMPVVGGVQIGLFRRDPAPIVRANWQTDYSFIVASDDARGVNVVPDNIVVPDEECADGFEANRFDDGVQIGVKLSPEERAALRAKIMAEAAIAAFNKIHKIDGHLSMLRVAKNYRNVPSGSISELFRRYSHVGCTIRQPLMNDYYNKLRQCEDLCPIFDFENRIMKKFHIPFGGLHSFGKRKSLTLTAEGIRQFDGNLSSSILQQAVAEGINTTHLEFISFIEMIKAFEKNNI